MYFLNNVHEKIFYRKPCPWAAKVDVTIYSYYKWYAKSGSHKLMANFLVYRTYCVIKNPFNDKQAYYRLKLLGWLLRAYVDRIYHALLPQVVSQKLNPQIMAFI